MGRGTSAGGGQSSLGYLFGGEEAATTQPPPDRPTAEPAPTANEPTSKNPGVVKTDQAPTTTYAANNYYRTDGQNCGNFITDRPSTKVHAAPGGGSSLDYLFGDGKK